MKGFTIKVDDVTFVEKQMALGFSDRDFTSLQISVITYMYLFPIDFSERLVKDKKTHSKKSVENIISDFRKEGLVIGKGKETKLNEEIKLVNDENQFFVLYVKA